MTTFVSFTDSVDYPQAAHINQYGTLFQQIPGPDGWMENGNILVSVTSNNITVALKNKAGNNPSASDPVTVWINGTKRMCTASLSVTKNAGTNWFASGSAALATKEIDYFVYLIWNTTPGTDIVDLGFARIPSGRVYSDFSGTTTNERYLAFANASTPTSTDSVVVIGRFAATLSASASYNWSVPTFTNANLIQHPIYETRWLSWTPTHSRNGTGYTNAPTVNSAKYMLFNNRMQWEEMHTQNGTPGGTGQQTFTLPFSVSLANAGAGYNATTFVHIFPITSSSTALATLFKYDGTAEATASQIYVSNSIAEI